MSRLHAAQSLAAYFGAVLDSRTRVQAGSFGWVADYPSVSGFLPPGFSCAAFLRGKPRFEHPEVVEAFLEFCGDAPLIAHNAAFDRGFINWELQLAGRDPLPEPRWTCTMVMARKRFPGMYNSLDALCKRFKISLVEREKHGALIDCRLLAQVYLELCGGRERGLELNTVAMKTAVAVAAAGAVYGARPRPLAPRSTEDERAAHAAFVAEVLKDKALWLKSGL